MDAMEKIQRAVKDLRRGKFVLVHDGENRENETDLIIPAQFVDKEHIKTMRKDGGGLIVIMTAGEIASRFNLPYLSDLYLSIADRYPIFGKIIPDDLPYDTKSAFSLSINHRKTFTGISDIDRSLTIRRFAELARDGNVEDFVREFRSPGHVPVCIARKDLLAERNGHTEMAVTLMKIAGLIPAAAGCEMMGDDGKSLGKEEAKKYAEENDLVFLEGHEIREVATEWLEC